MNPTKIKRKDLKRGDMFCEITAMADRPVMIAFKDGDDLVFDRSVFERDVHRFSWKDANIELSKDINLLTERVDANTLHTMTCGDAIADLRAQVKELTEENDILRDAVNKEGSLADNVVRDVEELHARLNECRHAKQTLQGIIDTLESDVEKLRMKIFDIEGREDLVTTELENENRNLKEDVAGKTEIIRQWKNNWYPAMCAKMQKTIDMLTSQIEELTEENDYLRDAVNKEGVLADNVVHDNKELESKIEKKSSYIKGLISDKTILQDTIQKMIVDEQTKRDNATCMRRHIAELEEQYDIDIQAWSKRESDLLQMVETRDNDLKMLDAMLKTVNPIIKSGEYAHPVESSAFLSVEMYRLCNEVIAYRRAHNM